MIKILINAESEGVEGVQSYDGDDPKAATEFVDGLNNVKDIQCHMVSGNEAGETRALTRRGKGTNAAGLISDIKAWLHEHDPEYTGNAPAPPPGEAQGEAVTIKPSDVASINAVVPDLTK